MTIQEAVDLIRPGVDPAHGTWADIGAGTGMFTKAIAEIMGRESRGNRESGGNARPNELRYGRGGSRENRERSQVYAVDKSPHALWQLKSSEDVEIIVIEADFNNPLDLPSLDGIVMANALHYALDHLSVLTNVVRSLKVGGTFLLVEYDTEIARPPWVPYPVSFEMFKNLCVQAGFDTPELLGRTSSVYHDDIYVARIMKS